MTRFEGKKQGKDSKNEDFTHRIKILSEKRPESESRLLKYNMISVGTVLTEFLMSVKPDDNENMAKFEAIIKDSGFPHANHEGDVQSLVNLSVADEILAGLDYGEPEKFAYLGEAFEESFYNLDMDRVCINNTT